MSQPISGAYVADELGVSRSAVSNWVARDSLPEALKPEMVKGPGKDRPQWRIDQLPGLRSWLAGHHPRRERTFITEVAPAGLEPGDIVISVQYGLRVSVLVRRRQS